MKDWEDLTEKEKEAMTKLIIDLNHWLDKFIEYLWQYIFKPALEVLSNIPEEFWEELEEIPVEELEWLK